MRDNHEGMPEFIRAFQVDGHYFSVVEVTIDEVAKRFQFGVSRRSYLILTRILQTRVFDIMPGLEYRYFYAGSCRPIDLQTDVMSVRIEQGRDATTRQFEITKELHSNLLWFSQLTQFEDAEYLEVDV